MKIVRTNLTRVEFLELLLQLPVDLLGLATAQAQTQALEGQAGVETGGLKGLADHFLDPPASLFEAELEEVRSGTFDSRQNFGLVVADHEHGVGSTTFDTSEVHLGLG